MILRDTLSAIVQAVEGALAAMIMARDGIPIYEATVSQERFDLAALAVEYAALVRDIRRTVEILKVGELEEVTITTGDLSVLIRALNEELFCVMILAREGNLGMARYQVRIRSAAMTRELS